VRTEPPAFLDKAAAVALANRAGVEAVVDAADAVARVAQAEEVVAQA
jgi:hypothetical protein